MDESFEYTEFKNLKIEFEEVSDELFLNLSDFITENLNSADKIDDNKNKLSEKKSVRCLTLEELFFHVKKTIAKDYKDADAGRKANKWDFKYFTTLNNHDDKTLNIYNRLQPKKVELGYLVYPLLSIRKYKESYYYWNHVKL